MKFLSAVLNLIFPSSCFQCGANGAAFCLNCLSKAPAAERESAEWINPLFDYRHHSVKKAIWLLKYKNRRGLAEVFAEALYGRILEELSELSLMENFQDPLLIPIPLSRKRYRERGFNQALLICKSLVELDQNKNLTLEKEALIKTLDTEHQARIENRSERLRNIIGSFAVTNEKKIKGRNIILIDDVTTTGATLSEAKKVLIEAGARKVIAFTVAH